VTAQPAHAALRIITPPIVRLLMGVACPFVDVVERPTVFRLKTDETRADLASTRECACAGQRYRRSSGLQARRHKAAHGV
jgi:hypothetical protein